MKSEEDWAEQVEINFDPRAVNETLESIKAVIRQVRVEALLHAANLARMGKMNGLRNERDRGHNLALDIMVENLEQRIKEIEEGK